MEVSSLLGLFSISFFWVLGIYFLFAGRISHWYMGSFLLIQGLANAILWFNLTPTVKAFPFLIFAAIPLRFLWGPFLFFFIKAFLEDTIRKNTRYYLHFLPFILITIFLVIQYFSLPQADIPHIVTDKVWLFKKNRFINILIFLQNVSYIIYLLIFIFKYQTKLSKQNSKTERIRLNWVINILVMLAGVHFLIPVVLNYIGPLYFKYLFVIHIPLLSYVAWHLIKTPALFQNEEKGEDEKLVPATVKDEKIEKILTDIMSNQMPFLDTEFSIKKLAHLVNIPAYQLSEILNRQFGKNFSEFTNQYRIEEAKRQLLTPENSHLTLEGIGQNCGFKSKSTFFSEFRKRCDKTPAEFRKQHSISNQ